MSAQQAESGPVDALVKMPPSVVAGFFVNSAIFRSIIQRHNDSPLLIPERGAWPIFAAASGSDSIETTLDTDVDIVRLPIGTFYIDGQDPTEKPRGLSSLQKKNILKKSLGDRVGKMVVIDEVQRGGTSSQLMDLLRNMVPPVQYQPHMLIAALDNRPKVAAQTKNPRYTEIVTGNVSGVETSSIPVPLIATDREPLLNRLVYDGDEKNLVDKYATLDIKIIDNVEATELFRKLGSLSRSLDALHSGDSIEELFDRPELEKTNPGLERWVEVFTHILQENAQGYQHNFMVDWPKADTTQAD